MIAKAFGPTGRSVSEIGQGTWDVPESGARLAAAIASIRRGVELGMTHIDTAEMYGAGRAEEIVGEAIAGIDRDRLFITSKVLPSNASFAGTIAACERSLQRLRLDYLDLYLLHWPSDEPLEQTMAALERLVQDGKTRAIGVSNFDVAGLREARSFLRSQPLAANQVLYNVFERGIELDVIPYCKQNQIAVVGYTPFGRSRFRAMASHATVRKIAQKHAKTERQVLLNFLTRDENVFAIPKASSIAHVEENASASGWRLNDEECAEIDGAFPARRGPLATL